MPDPKLSPADAARLRAETFAPMVEADLRAIDVHVGDGTLSGERLLAILTWIETGEWSGHVESEELVDLHKSSCKLSPEQRRRSKVLAARAIARQHGGSYRARGFEWRAEGGELKACLPGSN